MWYLINHPGKAKKGRRRMATKRRRAPSAAQLRARRKFAAMARARAKAARRKIRANPGGTMAKKKKKATTRRRRVIRSVRRGGKAVSRETWRASGFRRNPRRRRRARSYRRNPRRLRRSYRRNPFFGGGLVGDLATLGGQTVAALAGAALGRRIAALIPVADDPGKAPIISWAKAALIALGLKMVNRKFLRLPSQYVDAAALGVLLGPTKDVIVGFVPEAGNYLGDVMTLQPFSGMVGRRALASYSMNGMGAYAENWAEVVDDGSGQGGMGAYSGF